MTNAVKITINAWRDEEFFEGLNAEMKSELPESPLGKVKLHLVPECGNITLVNQGTNCSTSAADCCGTMFNNTCSTLFNDCCN